MVVGGAKSYSYKTNKGRIVVKQKGITLDMANDEVVNFDTMRDMVSNGGSIKSKERFNSNGVPTQKTFLPTMFQETSNKLSKKNERLMDTILSGGVGNI